MQLARSRELYLTTYNIHNRQTSITPVGFEPTISACQQPLNYDLDSAANGNGETYAYNIQNKVFTVCD